MGLNQIIDAESILPGNMEQPWGLSYNQRRVGMWVNEVGSWPSHPLTEQRYRIAGVALDRAARRMLKVLDDSTSLKWSDVAHEADMEWPEACKGIAMLVWAGLCEPGPLRFRLTEAGVRLLEESQDSLDLVL